MDRIFTHMEYLRENPPAGTLLKLFFESQSKKGKRPNSQQQSAVEDYDDGGRPRPKSFKNDEERLKWEEQQLTALIQIFGSSGGIIRKRKKGGVISG